MAKDSTVKGALVIIFTVKIEEFLNQRLTEISIAIIVGNFAISDLSITQNTSILLTT